MYGLIREGKFFCEQGRPTKGGWQFLHTGYDSVYKEESLWNTSIRRDKLLKIYKTGIEVYKFTDDDIQFLVMQRLRGNVRN